MPIISSITTSTFQHLFLSKFVFLSELLSSSFLEQTNASHLLSRHLHSYHYIPKSSLPFPTGTNSTTELPVSFLFFSNYLQFSAFESSPGSVSASETPRQSSRLLLSHECWITDSGTSGNLDPNSQSGIEQAVHTFWYGYTFVNVSSCKTPMFTLEINFFLIYSIFWIQFYLIFFNTIFVSRHMYPENSEDPSNHRLNEHRIYIRHCQESNSQPVPSQAGADPSRPQWRTFYWAVFWFVIYAVLFIKRTITGTMFFHMKPFYTCLSCWCHILLHFLEDILLIFIYEQQQQQPSFIFIWILVHFLYQIIFFSITFPLKKN